MPPLTSIDAAGSTRLVSFIVSHCRIARHDALVALLVISQACTMCPALCDMVGFTFNEPTPVTQVKFYVDLRLNGRRWL
jgi:hypothetical protein